MDSHLENLDHFMHPTYGLGYNFGHARFCPNKEILQNFLKYWLAWATFP